MIRPNPAACVTSFISSTNMASLRTGPDASMPTRTLPFSTPGASRSSRRPVNFSGRASCLSRAAVPESISSRDHGTVTPFTEVVRPEIGMPMPCPCCLQRIPDLRTRRLLLTSLSCRHDLCGRPRVSVPLGDSLRARDTALLSRPARTPGSRRDFDLKALLLLSLVGHLETSMNIPTVCSALILGGLVATIAPTTVSLAQSNDKGASASNSTPNTNTNPTKHRHWRHRGGTHPHFGSRRVRT
jgi:hypothetical protein